MKMRKLLVVLCVTLCCCNCNNSGYRFYQRERSFDVPWQQRQLNSSLTRRDWLCFVLGICATVIPAPVNTETPKLKPVHQWKQLEFDYATPAEREQDIASGVFTPGVIPPIDVDVYYSPDNKHNNIFVTVPKFTEGIPVTLGTVTHKNLDGNPIIAPYPDWNWHKNLNECHKDRLVSVFRVQIDECGRLWVLDTGKVGSQIICPPQIVAFDLNTNQVLHRHEFSSDVVTNQYLLVTLAVDVRDPKSGCRDTFVYVADVVGFALLVYDVASDISWRIQDKTFYPYPSFGTYTLAGESFELMDGILGLALSPHIPGMDRVLFYHAMSSPTENWVYTSNLRNSSQFPHGTAIDPHIFHTFPHVRSTQTAAEAIDKDGIMLFGLIKDLQIACWNSRSDYGPKNFDIIASDPVTLQFPSGVKIIRNRKGQQELWILTSRLQKVFNNTLNPHELNFRILAGKVEDLLFGTKCRSKHSHHNQGGGGSGGGYGLYGG